MPLISHQSWFFGVFFIPNGVTKCFRVKFSPGVKPQQKLHQEQVRGFQPRGRAGKIPNPFPSRSGPVSRARKRFRSSPVVRDFLNYGEATCSRGFFSHKILIFWSFRSICGLFCTIFISLKPTGTELSHKAGQNQVLNISVLV